MFIKPYCTCLRTRLGHSSSCHFLIADGLNNFKLIIKFWAKISIHDLSCCLILSVWTSNGNISYYIFDVIIFGQCIAKAPIHGTVWCPCPVSIRQKCLQKCLSTRLLHYRCTEVLSCKAVQKCSAVCLLHKEINNEQKGKQLERSSGLAGGQSTAEV